METKWIRMIELSAQTLLLVSVWRSASSMVMSTTGERLGVLQALEALAIPVMLLTAIGFITAAQIWVRGRGKPQAISGAERTDSKLPHHQAPLIDWREQVICDLRAQIATLREDRERLHGLLEEKSLRLKKDPLTGIYNRLAYNEQLEQEFHRWQRFASPLTFVIWDIDNFKQINDRYGHAMGDEVLCKVAAQLSERLRSTDFVARYGGEEFAMLLPGADSDAALKMVEQMRLSIAQTPIRLGNTEVFVTISCGISSYHPGDTPQSVFKRADQALYCAKHAGRNRCRAAA